MNKIDLIIATNIRNLMIKKELGQEYLAKKLNMSQSNLNQIIHEKIRCSNEDLYNLSQLLNVTMYPSAKLQG